MGLRNLAFDERELVRRCLKAATEGPFFPEWEFSTLFGLTREEVRNVWVSWNTLGSEDEVTRLAIHNCLANLLGYPHSEQTAWDHHISTSREDVARVFAKWREINRDFILDGVRKSVEALAADGETALALMPQGTVRADELALEFDNFGHAALETLGEEMTDVQRDSLKIIDCLLDAMSGQHQSHLWTDDAVRSDPKWQEVREAARRALSEFGWRRDGC
jgi:hypothetical protein